MLVPSAVLLLGTGCGGLYAAPSFNPLMFFLPGLVQNKPLVPVPASADLTKTNLAVAQAY